MPMSDRLLPPRVGGDPGNGEVDFDQAFWVRWGHGLVVRTGGFSEKEKNELRKWYCGISLRRLTAFFSRTGGKENIGRL
jgi:hypothetical protein